MQNRIFEAFMDELDKIATIIRSVEKGGQRHVSASARRRHVPEEGYDPKALFQGTEGSEHAREFAEEMREQKKGKPVKGVAAHLGISGEKEHKTPFQRRQAKKPALKVKK